MRLINQTISARLSKAAFLLVLLLASSLVIAESDPLEKGINAYNSGNFKVAYDQAIPLATHGYAPAENLLGMMYELGKGVTKDLAKSITYYRRAAEKGDMYAQYNLGVSYDSGTGVPQNYREASNWFQRAANQGARFAQYNLAVMYEQGRGHTKSFEKAAEWYEKAARQGHKQAQNNLAWLYEKGQGVQQDLITAYVWFDAAAVQGFEAAMHKRDLIKSSLSTLALKEATQRSLLLQQSVSQ